MIRFTGNIHKDMMCSCCGDVKKAKSKINSARRILSTMEREMNIKDLRPFIKGIEYNKMLRKLASSHNHAHFRCGTCNQVNMGELERLEKDINKYLAAAILYIGTLEVNKARLLKRELFDIFRGHYPIAARLIDRIDIERGVF